MFLCYMIITKTEDTLQYQSSNHLCLPLYIPKLLCKTIVPQP